MKNVVKRDNYNYSVHLAQNRAIFLVFNYERYHELINRLILSNVYYGIE